MVKLYGKQVNNLELLDLFQADEGDIELIYGRIGEGKTTEAVRRMLETLKNGGVVYTNIKLDLSECIFDDRVSIRQTLANLIWFRKRYYSFRKENYHYFNPDDYEPQEMVEFLSKLTDCEIYYDEGHWLLDSYEGTKISKQRRKLVLETRHFNRKLVLITQRPTAIAVSARGNVNRFWRCKVVLRLFGIMCMRVEQFQDMIGETVDETVCISKEFHFNNSEVFRVFNTHGLRGGVARSQEVFVDAYDLNLKERMLQLLQVMFNFLPKKTNINIKKNPKLRLSEALDFDIKTNQEKLPF